MVARWLLKKEKSLLTEKALEDSSAVLVPRRQNAPVGQMERRLWAEAVEEVEAEPRACNSVECQSPIFKNMAFLMFTFQSSGFDKGS